LKNSNANFIWFLTPKHFPCGALEAQLICALQKLNRTLVRVSKNASNFLLNGQLSVPEWCVDFFLKHPIPYTIPQMSCFISTAAQELPEKENVLTTKIFTLTSKS